MKWAKYEIKMMILFTFVLFICFKKLFGTYSYTQTICVLRVT